MPSPSERPTLSGPDAAAREEQDAALSVLVVDDDEPTRRSVRRVLMLDGYQVDTACSGQELLAIPQLDAYFAILLDRKLPDADASDLLKQLRQQAPNPAILIITGHADVHSTIAALRQGVDDYLIKPVDPETLRSRLIALAELHRVRRELQRSEKRMQVLVEHLPVGAVYVDDDRLFVNRAIERYTGYRAEQLPTVDAWFQILCGDTAADCRQLYEVKKAEGFPEAFVVDIQRSDGVRCSLEVAGYHYSRHEIWLVNDVTQLREAQQKLLQSARLAAIGEMVTGLAHESRNALQRARGCLDLLELDLEGQHEQLDLTQRIRRALNDLQRNYEEVRGYAAPVVLRRSWVDTADVLGRAFEDLRCEFQHAAHRLNVTVQASETCIQADAHRLNQVFRNVLENAMAASPEGANIQATVADSTVDRQAYQSIEIRDQGAGMSGETAARMFEPFYTTKHSGTGLGMAICKRIVDAHGGSIRADSDPASGTVITILLPVGSR